MSNVKRRAAQECNVRKAEERLSWSGNLTLTTGDSQWVSHRGFDKYGPYSPSSMEHKYRRSHNHSYWNLFVIPVFILVILISIIANITYLTSSRAANKPQNLSTNRNQNQHSLLVDETHIEHLIERLRSIDGITLHEGRLYDVIAKSGGNLHEVTDTLKRLLSHDVPHEERVFFID